MKSIVLPLCVGITFLLLNVYLFRKGKLSGRTLYRWLIQSFLIIFAAFVLPTSFSRKISVFFGINQPTEFFILAALSVLLGMQLLANIAESKQEKQITRLTQEVALLKLQCEKEK